MLTSRTWAPSPPDPPRPRRHRTGRRAERLANALMRSPMMQKGRSTPITIWLDRELDACCMRSSSFVSLLEWSAWSVQSRDSEPSCRKSVRWRPRTPGARVPRLLEREQVGLFGLVGSVLDTCHRLGGNVDAGHLAMHEGERARAADKHDRRQDGRVLGHAGVVQGSNECPRAAPGKWPDLELQEAGSGHELSSPPRGAVGERRGAGVLDRADEEARRRSWRGPKGTGRGRASRRR